MSSEESSETGGKKTKPPKVAIQETRRTISPYDLTASDNPGAIISYPRLDGQNYDEWSLSFKTALCSRKKFGFLDGSITKPKAGSADYEDWIPINALLVSWIKMTIHESLCPSISHREIAKDLWESLKQRFSISNRPRLQQIKADIAMCKQHGQSIENYYGRLCKIWDQLSVLQPIRRCTCGQCTCNLADLLDQDREADRVQQLLYGVDDNLQSIRSTLVSRTPLPRLEEAYNLLRQEEDIQMQGKRNNDRSEAMALAALTKQTWSNKEDKSKLYCSHCKRTGHATTHCFALIGYPEWWGERNRGKPQNCTRRDKIGDKAAGTTLLRATANVAATQGLSSAPQQLLSSKDRDSVMGLSDEQWEKVVTLINAGNNATPSEQLTGPHYEDSDWSW